MPDALTAINLRRTPQTMRADDRQVKNSAGGYTFTVAPIERLRRFLVLGTEGGTYYTSERKLTADNAGIVLDWAKNHTTELVTELVDLSVAGRSPKQNPILFALAAAASLGDNAGRKAALDALPLIARTGTHLFLFATYAEQFRGWGRGLRHAVANWYTTKPVDDVAYQVVKYRQREGWSHRDLLRLSHPQTDEPSRKGLFDWACGREAESTPEIVGAFVSAQAATTVKQWVDLIGAHRSLSWEMLPDAALNEKLVWEALIDQGIPQTALMRQLPRLTRLGVLSPMSDALATVVTQLVDPTRLAKARVHPINVLVAARTYAAGASARGDSTWQPISQVTDALDAAFYAAFGSVEATGKRTLLALDVSASMTWAPCAGLPITPREASAALSLVTAAVEPKHHIMAFSQGMVPVDISPRQRLTDSIRAIESLPASGTDCSIPMLWAIQTNTPVDTFVVYTDNETHGGQMHPHQALREYRNRTGIDARLAVVGMTATDFTIADPADAGMLDVAGFDSAVPELVSNFSARAI